MKLYDHEFGTSLLAVLRNRELLAQGNQVHYVALHYNIGLELAKLEQDFQQERRTDPLLEQTPPLTWLAAKLVPYIGQIRPNIRVTDKVLSLAVRKYLRRHLSRQTAITDLEQQELVRTMEPYLSAVRKLLNGLYDRRRSLAGLLALTAKTYSLRRSMKFRKPKSLRDRIYIRGITEGYSNARIARDLDDADVRPRKKSWQGYAEMNLQDPKQFQVLKSHTKSKYLVTAKKPT